MGKLIAPVRVLYVTTLYPDPQFSLVTQLHHPGLEFWQVFRVLATIINKEHGLEVSHGEKFRVQVYPLTINSIDSFIHNMSKIIPCNLLSDIPWLSGGPFVGS